jgi:CRP/FNR family transcriptional regulator, cyclic AMP receptor protein
VSHPSPSITDTVSLLSADPDLGALLPPERRREAETELVVRACRLGAGPWDVSSLVGVGAEQVGLMMLDGVIWREVGLGGQLSAELLGPGDLLRPWQFDARDGLLPVMHAYTVLAPATLALLDRRFATTQLPRWPEITTLLLERLTERSFRLATAQAISQLTRVDRRIAALLWHLAERWGRVSGDGVLVPLPLTHRMLGELVGARRPTVSTALATLAERGEVSRRRDGTWLLRGDPEALADAPAPTPLHPVTAPERVPFVQAAPG